MPSRYTTAGYNKQRKGFTRRNKGWTDEGVKRFNYILERVKKDRQDNGKWFDDIISKHKEKNDETDDDGEDQMEDTTNWTKAANDLFDDDGPPMQVLPMAMPMEVTEHASV
jgi:hypothetical protein